MYFKEITDFKNFMMYNTFKNKTFEESLKNRGVFRTQVSISDGAFLRIYLTPIFGIKAPLKMFGSRKY